MVLSQPAQDDSLTGSMPPFESGPSWFHSRWATPLGAGLIMLAGVAVYWNSFAGVFVFDDQTSIVENPTIRKLWPLGPVFSPPRNGETVSGRPLLNLSLALNYAISGKETWSYHLANLGIHLANALLLLGLVRRTLQRPVVPPSVRDHALPLAWTIALVWTVHPLQTEAVTYIVERAESLVAFFYLLMLYAILRSDEAGHPRWWQGLAVGACLLGMASKEVMVTAPVMAIVYDRTFLAGTFRKAWRRRARMYVFLAATWLVLIGLVWSTGLLLRREEFEVPSWWSYALAQPRSILYYLRLAIWPHPLCAYYAWPVCQSWLEILPALVAVLVAGVAVIWAMVKRPMWGFAGFWFFGILVPTSSVIPLHDVMVERRMYLSLAAVLTLVVVGGYLVGRRWLGRRVLVVGTCLVITVAVVLGVLTHQRNEDYRSELSMWEDTLRKAPDNPYAHNNLGNALTHASRLAEAIKHLEEVVRLKPEYALGHINLGAALRRSGRVSEAIEHYEEAIRLKPQYAVGHNDLGVVLYSLGRLSEGIEHCREAIRLKADYADAHSNLGLALAKAGRLPEAVEHHMEAIRLNPSQVTFHNNLGNAILALGRPAEAVKHYEAALAIDPTFAATHNNLGMVLTKTGRLPEAIERYAEAIRLDPKQVTFHNNLGNAMLAMGRSAEAIKHYEVALQIDPTFAGTHSNLGNAMLALNRPSEAIEHLQRAVQLQPNLVTPLYDLGNALAQAGRLPEAIEQFREAVRRQPEYPNAQLNLVLSLAQAGKFREAIEQGRRAIELIPRDVKILRLVAWIMSTHESTEGGDPTPAVELAERACTLTGRRDIACLDTLAAAYASAGRFDDAVATAKEAWQMAQAAGQGSQAEDIHIRLQLYRDRKPYRISNSGATLLKLQRTAAGGTDNLLSVLRSNKSLPFSVSIRGSFP